MKQGDPLSIHLYNGVIGMCLAGLDLSLGCEVGWLRVNHDAFADDIAWFAATPCGLQALASELETQLSLCGLSIRSGPQGKSASLCLDIEGKVKKQVTQVYRYPGVDVSPRRTKANVAGTLRDGLVSILWAKLKPQQRLYTATYHLLLTCQQMVDGRGLVHSSQVPQCHRWVNSVSNGGAPNTASSFIAAIKVQENLIGTALRSS